MHVVLNEEVTLDVISDKNDPNLYTTYATSIKEDELANYVTFGGVKYIIRELHSDSNHLVTDDAIKGVLFVYEEVLRTLREDKHEKIYYNEYGYDIPFFMNALENLVNRYSPDTLL